MTTVQIIALTAALIFSALAAVSAARIWASIQLLKSAHKKDNLIVTNKVTGKDTVVSRRYNEREKVSRRLLELSE